MTSTSDARMKENIVPMSNGLNIINQIEPIYYDYTEEASVADELRRDKQSGVTAQQVKSLVPECISYLDSEDEVELEYENIDGVVSTVVDPAVEDPIMMVEYKKFIPYLIGAVKELSDKLDGANAKIEALENA